MQHLLKKVILVIVLCFIGNSYTASIAAPFWSDEINNAFSKHDAYFSKIGITSGDINVNAWTSDKRNKVKEYLEHAQSPENPWYNFLMGVLSLNLQASQADNFFKNALNTAQSDPGTIWTLFVEFSSCKLYTWADTSLNLLEKQMLISGAISAPIISQQLIQSAINYEKNGNTQIASSLFEQAKKFDPNQTWAISHQILNEIPFKKSGFAEVSDYAYILKHSWAAQIGFVEALYLLFHNILLAFVIIIYLILCWKFFPKALHYFSDLYPLSISPFLRQILTVSAICSLVSFGIIPFLWLCAFLIWKYTAKIDRGLLIAATALLTCSPLDIRIQDMIHQVLNPCNELNLLSRSITEGYSENLIRVAHLETEKSPSNAQAWLSLSNSALKAGNYSLASASIKQAEQLKPHDPVLLVTAGNLAFCKGNLENARFYYSEALANGAQDVSARFNLAQCSFQKLETISGADLIKDAARTEPALVNSFIQKNDFYFSKHWPLLRTIMFPDYTPEYFWTKLFINYSGTWKTAEHLWGKSFLGIPPLFSLFIFILFFSSLIIFYNPEHFKRKPRKLVECRYCGRVICQKCRSAMVCQSCANMTRLVGSERALSNFQFEIAQNSWVNRSIVNQIFDILFPGAGKYLDGQKYVSSTILLIITCTFYACYLEIFKGIETFQTEFNFTMVILFAYNIFFGWKRVSSILTILNKKFIRSS